MKFCPVTVNVNAAPPALTKFGLRERIAGTGFDGDDGWLPAELLDPPPQPPANSKDARDATISVAVMAFRFLPWARACLDEIRRTELNVVRLINLLG